MQLASGVTLPFYPFKKKIIIIIISPRLQLTPSPSPQGAGGAQGPRDNVSRGGRGRKRKRASGSSPALSTHAMARGSMSVAEVDPDGNYVVLRNDAQEVRHLSSLTHLLFLFLTLSAKNIFFRF